ncbi:GNAT family N-acetyltransferase [Propioniciclava soli]|uniref:GNAT family N-acetyltransferase n=1 Tax=Propioniciclava soli TaxID=2775081 RepID=A0ABZ3C6F8_9ACTN|nr:GNAT family N-acetyltransferase [Propioniciclava soli]
MEILAYLDDVSIARATRDDVDIIERLLADDPTSPKHVATTTLISDDILGEAHETCGLATAFERIDRDPNQLLAVVLDDTERVIGTFQLSFLSTMARGGAMRAIVNGARIRAGDDSVAVGRDVFRWIKERARTEGARVLMVATEKDRSHVHGFYTTMGFRPTHEGLTLVL